MATACSRPTGKPIVIISLTGIGSKAPTEAVSSNFNYELTRLAWTKTVARPSRRPASSTPRAACVTVVIMLAKADVQARCAACL